MVHVDRRDPDYWLSSAVEATAPDAFKKTFAQSHRTVDPYVQAGRLQPFDGRTVLFPGISSVPEHGHTPGHSGYLIESEGQRLLLWGDVIHAAEVQFRDPTVTIDFDVDRDAAIASRRQALLSASQDGYLVGGAHLSFPGIGHVRADGDGFAWMPAPYSAAMPAGQTIGKGAAR
jgi:glyoxylase-like metal-dependent hydrolase (beta-lactamase superfamily II)